LFQRCDPLFGSQHGGIADARIDKAALLTGIDRHKLGGVGSHEGRRLIDRGCYSSKVLRWVHTSVNGPAANPVFPVRCVTHFVSSREMMMRRISDVPPPISASLESRKCRCMSYSIR